MRLGKYLSSLTKPELDEIEKFAILPKMKNKYSNAYQKAIH